MEIEDWQNVTYIYTDASLYNESIGVGISWVATDNYGRLNHTIKSNIGDKVLVYNGELEALTQAIEYASKRAENGHHFEIYSDNQAAILRLANLSDNPGQSCQIRAMIASERIMTKNATLSLNWIPGHSGIKGNEVADKLAKEASRMLPETMETSFAMMGSRLKSEIRLQ